MPLSIANRPSASESMAIITQFLELGGNFIDTADVYGLDIHDAGHNEQLIHRALERCHASNRVIVATKGGATRPQGGWSFYGGGSPQHLRKACEASLHRLGKEAHDLYYLHGIDPLVPFEVSLGELTRLKEEGKIKQIGIANVNYDELVVATKMTSIAAVQNRCNPWCKADLNNGVLEFCKNNNIQYVAYCPLGGWADHQALISSASMLALKAKYGVSVYAISLAWLISCGDNILPIPGMDKCTQVQENFSALNLKLDLADIELINGFPNHFSPKHTEIDRQ